VVGDSKHIATLRRARPGIVIEIRWCPAHKGITGNEKADKWAKIAAEEPDTGGVEWLNYSDRTEVRAMPLPRSLANLKREISEKKWGRVPAEYPSADEIAIHLSKPRRATGPPLAGPETLWSAYIRSRQRSPNPARKD